MGDGALLVNWKLDNLTFEKWLLNCAYNKFPASCCIYDYVFTSIYYLYIC